MPPKALRPPSPRNVDHIQCRNGRRVGCEPSKCPSLCSHWPCNSRMGMRSWRRGAMFMNGKGVLSFRSWDRFQALVCRLVGGVLNGTFWHRPPSQHIPCRRDSLDNTDTFTNPEITYLELSMCSYVLGEDMIKKSGINSRLE